MRLRLLELQIEDVEIQEIRQQDLKKVWKDIERVLNFYELS